MRSFSDDLLNIALALATEWGENFRKPIDERLRLNYPQLTDDDIEDLTTAARRAESRIYELAEHELAGQLAESDIVLLAVKEFPWLNLDNALRLKNIGMYYARR